MLTQFKLESYVSDDESIRVDRVTYADTPEEAYRQYVNLVNEKDDDGNKKFISTRLYVGSYKQMSDPMEFFNIFKS